MRSLSSTRMIANIEHRLATKEQASPDAKRPRTMCLGVGASSSMTTKYLRYLRGAEGEGDGDGDFVLTVGLWFLHLGCPSGGACGACLERVAKPEAASCIAPISATRRVLSLDDKHGQPQINAYSICNFDSTLHAVRHV